MEVCLLFVAALIGLGFIVQLGSCCYNPTGILSWYLPAAVGAVMLVWDLNLINMFKLLLKSWYAQLLFIALIPHMLDSCLSASVSL